MKYILNMQDQEQKHVTTLRVLKNRFSGDTGIASNLQFDVDTGRMSEYTFDSI